MVISTSRGTFSSLTVIRITVVTKSKSILAAWYPCANTSDDVRTFAVIKRANIKRVHCNNV